MPKYATGNMFDLTAHPCDLLLVTANSIVNSKGELVMGRGAAQQAARTCPGLARAYGELLSNYVKCHPLSRGLPHRTDGAFEYNLLFDWRTVNDEPWPGIFQVKYHWKEAADLGLIERSVEALYREAMHYRRNVPSFRISLNFPGIGNGRLPEASVRPLLEKLPDNVTVWKLR